MSVDGAWHGVRHFIDGDEQLQPVAFSASFRAAPCIESNLYGDILGGGGGVEPEALIGSQTGAMVHFSSVSAKPAFQGERAAQFLEFAGYLSEDGTVMRGCWRARRQSDFSGINGGTWTARRSK